MAKAEWARTTAIVDAAAEILGAEYPMTLRQCFYRLVSKGVIENSRSDYQGLSRILTKARNDGRIEFEWITDRSRPTYSPCVFENPKAYAETIKSIYRKDYWNSQPNYVEVWTEKDSVTGSIQQTTDELGVTVRVGRGFNSTTRAHEIAEHFRSKDKAIVVFYLGDFDPSGVAIEEDVAARIRTYGADFTMERLAIHSEDIHKFKLPPLRVKDSDTRAAAFLRKHGNESVELDALPVAELRRRIDDRVWGLIDHSLWNRAVAVEKVEIASILEGMKSWNNLPPLEAA
jgi:hypothetical protein